MQLLGMLKEINEIHRQINQVSVPGPNQQTTREGLIDLLFPMVYQGLRNLVEQMVAARQALGLPDFSPTQVDNLLVPEYMRPLLALATGRLDSARRTLEALRSLIRLRNGGRGGASLLTYLWLRDFINLSPSTILGLLSTARDLTDGTKGSAQQRACLTEWQRAERALVIAVRGAIAAKAQEHRAVELAIYKEQETTSKHVVEALVANMRLIAMGHKANYAPIVSSQALRKHVMAAKAAITHHVQMQNKRSIAEGHKQRAWLALLHAHGISHPVDNERLLYQLALRMYAGIWEHVQFDDLKRVIGHLRHNKAVDSWVNAVGAFRRADVAADVLDWLINHNTLSRQDIVNWLAMHAWLIRASMSLHNLQQAAISAQQSAASFAGQVFGPAIAARILQARFPIPPLALHAFVEAALRGQVLPLPPPPPAVVNFLPAA
jgi:hypothetical protein